MRPPRQSRLLKKRRDQVLRGLALVLPRGALPRTLVFFGSRAHVFIAVVALSNREFCVRGNISGGAAVFITDGPAKVREYTPRELVALAMCQGVRRRDPSNPTVRWFYRNKENHGKTVVKVLKGQRQVVR